jgi:hypothetical protein
MATVTVLDSQMAYAEAGDAILTLLRAGKFPLLE